MKSITTLENIPDSLDIQEMMDVKGGAEINEIITSDYHYNGAGE